jgi:hypothetical protein
VDGTPRHFELRRGNQKLTGVELLKGKNESGIPSRDRGRESKPSTFFARSLDLIWTGADGSITVQGIQMRVRTQQKRGSDETWVKGVFGRSKSSRTVHGTCPISFRPIRHVPFGIFELSAKVRPG